jgi:ABC-type multidrug transport system ATPase subunit
MVIHVDSVSKQFGTEYILKNMVCKLEAGKVYALAGPNGSGKSTFMKLLSGFLSPTKGRIHFTHTNGKQIMPDAIYKHVAYAAPYIELIEEFTLLEVLHFHAQTRGWRKGLTMDNVLEITELGHARDREIRHFSSGMKQRVKIAIALCTDADYVLLDEPTTNLDVRAVQWYLDTTRQLADGRLVVIASNDPVDLDFADERIDVMDFKVDSIKRLEVGR